MSKNNIKEWELIIDKIPLRGSWNMAVDDYLFRSLDKNVHTYLRFYRWEKPTISLGYGQKVGRVVDVDYCLENGIDIVRRITGGKLVLHHKEVTYSVCSSDKEIFTSNLDDSYKLISEALMKGLEKMGLHPYLADSPPISYIRGNLPCFSYPAHNEVKINEKKIIGSAQKRMGSKFIQHGSIPLEDNEHQLKSVSFLDGKDESVRMISVSQAFGKKVSFEVLVKFLIKGIADYFRVSFKEKVFDTNEKEIIKKIQNERYDNPAWTYLKK